MKCQIKIVLRIMIVVILMMCILGVNISAVVLASDTDNSIVEDGTQVVKKKAKTIEFSLFEEINNSYKIKNTKFEYDKNNTIMDILKVLKKDGYIQMYKAEDQKITHITFNDKTSMSSGDFGDSSGFIIVVNDAFIEIDPLKYKLKSGDKIKLIYTTDITTMENKNALGITGIKGSQQSLISVWSNDLSKVLNSACAKIGNTTENISITSLISLGIAKKEVLVSDIIRIANKIEQEEHDMDIEYVSELLIASYACGIDPASVNNKKYVENIIKTIVKKDYKKDAKEVSNALMALATVTPRNNDVIDAKDALVIQIKSMQNDDGGFGKSKDKNSDCLSTARAIIALSTFKSEKGVNTTIDEAIQFLSDNVVSGEVFVAGDMTSVIEISTVITALSCANISVKDTRFSVGEQNLISLMLKFYLQDGSFSKYIGGEYDEEATASAIIALIAAKKGKNPYDDMENYKKTDVNNYNVKEVKKSALVATKQVMVKFVKKNIQMILTLLVVVFLLCVAFIIDIKNKKSRQNKGE